MDEYLLELIAQDRKIPIKDRVLILNRIATEMYEDDYPETMSLSRDEFIKAWIDGTHQTNFLLMLCEYLSINQLFRHENRAEKRRKRR